MSYDTFQDTDLINSLIQDVEDSIMICNTAGEFMAADIFMLTLKQLIDLRDHEFKETDLN